MKKKKEKRVYASTISSSNLTNGNSNVKYVRSVSAPPSGLKSPLISSDHGDSRPLNVATDVLVEDGNSNLTVAVPFSATDLYLTSAISMDGNSNVDDISFPAMAPENLLSSS